MHEEFKEKRFLVHSDNNELFLIKPCYYPDSELKIRNPYDYIYAENFLYKNKYTCTYETDKCHIEENDIVVDVGANIGIFVNRALYRGAKEVIAFEPSKYAFTCLLENTKYENVNLFKVGIGDYENIGILKTPGNIFRMGEASLLSTEKFTNNFFEETIKIETLDSYFKIGILINVDFLKIDCEGFEYNVIKGISDNNLNKIKKITIEIHEDLIGTEKVNYIKKRLKKAGFNIEKLDDENINILNFYR